MAKTIPVRTPEELQDQNYNYFIAFGVTAMEAKNAAAIKSKLDVAKKDLTKGDVKSRRYKELWTDIEEIMLNDSVYDAATGTYKQGAGGRAAELANAKKLKLSNAVNIVVGMSKTKGRIYNSEMQKLCIADKGGFFTLPELKKEVDYLFTKTGVKFIDDSKVAVDFKMYDEMYEYLNTLKKANIYDFLEIPSESLTEKALAQVKVIYNKVSKNVDSKGAAAMRLCGACEKIFKTDEERKKFDNYVATRDLVWNSFRIRSQSGIKELTMGEFIDFCEKVKTALGITADEVDEVYMTSAIKAYGIVLTGEGYTGKIDLETCPYPDCGKTYDAASNPTVCPHCGKPLVIKCWNCGDKMSFTTKSKSCKKCGISYNLKAIFTNALSEFDRQFNMNADLATITASLDTLKNIFPEYAKYPGSYIQKEVSERDAKVSKKLAEEKTVGAAYKKDLEAVEAFVMQKNYMQANSRALRMKSAYPTYNIAKTSQLLTNISSELSKARTYFAQAQSAATANRENDVIVNAAKTLEICADFMDAKQLLQKFPPKAPYDFKVAAGAGSVVKLEWKTLGAQQLTTFTVIKKIGSKPVNPKDGAIVAEGLSINFFEDKNVVSATPYHYAVFASRMDVTSAMVSAPVPIEIYCEVSNIQQKVTEGKICVSWEPPLNVKSVIVRKNKGQVAPLNETDGTAVKVVDNKSFEDSDADGACAYLILCKYTLANGQERSSKGVQRVFKAFRELRPLSGINIAEGENKSFILNCDKTSDTVKLYYAKAKPACRCNVAIKSTDFATSCKELKEAALIPESECWSFRLPDNELLWLYPSVWNEQLFMLSSPTLVNTVNGVNNVTYTERGGSVNIKGVLNPYAKNVIAKIRHDRYSESFNDESDIATWDKKTFESGCAELKLKSNTVNYITLYTEMETEGIKTISRGAKLPDVIDYREAVTVFCELDYSPVINKSYKATVKFSSEIPVTMPKTMLLRGARRPMDKQSGSLVEEIQPVELKKGFLSSKYTAKITVTVPPDIRANKLRLFISDDRDKHVNLKDISKII